MIRRQEPDSVWVIRQAAHAYISGQIAAHWTAGGITALFPYEELLVAAACHDAGWTAADQQPRINGQGQPRTFTEMDLDEHFAIWQHSIEAVFAQNRYAGLLTAMHCTALYEIRLRTQADPADARQRIERFIETWQAWQESLSAVLKDHPRYALAVQPDLLADNLRRLQVWDYLSLLLCMGSVSEQIIDDVPLDGERKTLRVAASGPRGMALDPFPLDGPLTVWIDAQPVGSGVFETDDDLRQVLAGVPYRPLVFELGAL